MPRYYFHLLSPEEDSVDDVGNVFPNAEAAYLGAYEAALDISFEMLRARQDPSRHHFDVRADDGKLLFDLPFADVLRPTGAVRLAAVN